MADSLTWKVPANASRGSTAASRSRGSRASSMLSLSWAPSAGGSGSRLAEQAGEHGRGDGGEHVPGGGRAAVPADLAVGVDRGHLDAAADLGAGLQRGAGERVGERAHAADGHVPVPSPLPITW